MNTTPSSSPHVTPTTASDRPRSDQDQPQVEATRQADSSNTRALVLAGAGAAGNAWELGLIAGLADAGVDLTAADVIIGTSAGSTVAAQITSGTRPAELYAAILAEVPQPRAGDVRIGQEARSESLGAGLHGVVEHDHRFCRGCVRHAPQDRRRGTRDGCLRRLSPDAMARHRRGSASQPPLAATARADSGCRRPRPGNRSCSTATAESTWWTPSPPAPRR